MNDDGDSSDHGRSMILLFATSVISLLLTWYMTRAKKAIHGAVGPKAILSSLIAAALDKFFFVDQMRVESKLLFNTHIVLHGLRLRSFEGVVETVEFDWVWSRSGFIKDARLVIKGVKLQLNASELFRGESTASNKGVEYYTVQATSRDENVKAAGGLKAYIQEQVQRVLDSLALQLADIDIQLFLPSGTTVRVMLESAEFLSSGKEKGSTLLQQRMSIASLCASVIYNGKVYLFLEPFGYRMEVTQHAGQRFDSWRSNLRVTGHDCDTDVVFCVEPVQSLALSELMDVVMAEEPAPSSSSAEMAPTQPDDAAEADPAATKLHASGEAKDDASMLTLHISNVLFSFGVNGTRIRIAEVVGQYRADGTVMKIEAARLRVSKKEKAVEMLCISGIHVSLTPPALTLDFDEIQKLYMPGVIELSSPIIGVRVSLEGGTVSIAMDSMEATLLEKSDIESDGASADEGTSGVLFPIPMTLSLKHLQLKQSNDGSSMQFRDVNFFVNPMKDSSTQFALQLGQFQNHLLEIDRLHAFGVLPVERQHQVDGLLLSADSARVTAGYSVNDWVSAFNPNSSRTSDKQISKLESAGKPCTSSDHSSVDKKTPPSVYWKLPCAKVASLRLMISYSGTGVRVDDEITIDAFQGREDTTAKHLVQYYAQACLERASDFITNADILGFNVVDSWGAWLGMATMGPLGGLVVIGAVDGVRSAIAAGKRSRNADNTVRYRRFDLVRGIVHTMGETARTGAAQRGREDADATDFVVGSAMATVEYAKKNRTRLIAVGAGGGAMIGGAILGGPVGAIVCGVVVQAVTKKSLDEAEKVMKERNEKTIESEPSTVK